MKKVGGITILILVFACMFLGYKYTDERANVDSLQLVIDSVRAIQVLPPDTVIRYDTIVSDTTIYVHRTVKEIQYVDSTKLGEHYRDSTKLGGYYRDSLVNDKIRVWIDIYAKTLYNLNWEYQPVIQQEKVEIKVPYPVIVDKPVKVIQESKGLYGLGGLGFGTGFVGRIGLGYMPNSRRMYGIDIMKVDDKTVYGGYAAFRLFK